MSRASQTHWRFTLQSTEPVKMEDISTFRGNEKEAEARLRRLLRNASHMGPDVRNREIFWKIEWQDGSTWNELAHGRATLKDGVEI